tara:strand:- start:285 stop:629 length:345 start_codon:yes stop_codon:yes gene_type:complete
LPLPGVIQHGQVVTEENAEENHDPAIPEGETAHNEEPDPDKRKGSLLLRVRIVILLLMGAAFLVVATANRQSITIDLIAKKIEFSLSLTLILTFFGGTIAGLFLAYFRPWRKRD